MTVYLDKKVIEKNIDAEPSAYVSARSTADARSLQVGVKPTRNAVRTKASSRWLAVGGTSLLVALCLVMFPMVGRGEGITPVYPLEDVREIVIDASILDVELVPTDNNELGVYWEASDSWDVHVSSEDGVLSIGEDSTIGLHSIRDLDEKNKSRKLTVEVPATYEGNLTVKARTSSITVSGIDIAGDVALSTPYGRVDISALHVQGGLSISSDTGDLYLEDIVADGRIYVENKTGNLTLSNVISKDLLAASTLMGSIGLRDTNAVTMELSTQYGEVRARQITAESDIYIYSYFGDISCQLQDKANAYTVHCSSIHGSTNVPDADGNGDKRLDIESKIGDIAVAFAL